MSVRIDANIYLGSENTPYRTEIGRVCLSGGNYYMVAVRDNGASPNDAMVLKTSDPTTADNWTAQDTANEPTPMALGAGDEEYIAVASRQEGTTMHIVLMTQRIGNDDYGIQYVAFNMSTDTWGTEVDVHDMGGVYTATGAGSAGLHFDIDVRSDGDLVIVYQGPTESIMGSGYGRIYETHYEGTSWSTPQQLDTGGEERFVAPAMAINQTTDRCHMVWSNLTTTPTHLYRTLSSTNSLSTEQSTSISGFGGSTTVYCAAAINSSKVVFHISETSQNNDVRFLEAPSDGSAYPTQYTSATPTDAQGWPDLVWDSTDSLLHLIYRDANNDMARVTYDPSDNSITAETDPGPTTYSGQSTNKATIFSQVISIGFRKTDWEYEEIDVGSGAVQASATSNIQSNFAATIVQVALAVATSAIQSNFTAVPTQVALASATSAIQSNFTAVPVHVQLLSATSAIQSDFQATVTAVITALANSSIQSNFTANLLHIAFAAANSNIQSNFAANPIQVALASATSAVQSNFTATITHVQLISSTSAIQSDFAAVLTVAITALANSNIQSNFAATLKHTAFGAATSSIQSNFSGVVTQVSGLSATSAIQSNFVATLQLIVPMSATSLIQSDFSGVITAVVSALANSNIQSNFAGQVTQVALGSATSNIQSLFAGQVIQVVPASALSAIQSNFAGVIQHTALASALSAIQSNWAGVITVIPVDIPPGKVICVVPAKGNAFVVPVRGNTFTVAADGRACIVPLQTPE